MFIAKAKIIVALLLIMLLATAGIARALARPGVDPKADAILDRTIAQLAAFRSYAMHVDHSMTIVHNIEESKRFGGWIASSDIRADGENFDEMSDTWDIPAGQSKPHRQFNSRSIWDGKRETHRQQYQGEPNQQILATISSRHPRWFPSGDGGLVLHGRAYGDATSMPQVMRESGSARLRPAREDVDGHLCDVIDAKTARGTYTLWIDPAAGHLFRRTRVVKRAGDLTYEDKPIASNGTEATTTGTELELHDIVIDHVGGEFVLIRCIEEVKTFVGDAGQYRLDRGSYTRSKLELSPDFAKLGAFVMDGIPERSRVISTDKDGPYARATMTWVNDDVFVSAAPAPTSTKLPSRMPRIGSTPPDIQGVDMSGKPMKLSDYRGKVVVVVFWSSACGPCMTMIPHEQELVKRLKDKPFVLLGVNAWDSHDTAVATIAKEKMTWPSWFDNGTDGPICRLWDIHGLPAIFVLDTNGVVRHEDVRGGDLDQAIYSLLEPGR